MFETTEELRDRVYASELAKAGHATPYRLVLEGPGFLTTNIGTGTMAEVEGQARQIAREVKQREGLRWISWKIVRSAPRRLHW